MPRADGRESQVCTHGLGRCELRTGKLPAALEVAAYYYGYGKPRDTLEVAARYTVTDESRMSDEELGAALLEAAQAVVGKHSKPKE